MSQTLMAMLALAVVTTFAMNVQQKHMHVQRTTIQREIAEMAASSALEAMEIIRAREFDQAVVNGTATGSVADLALFSYEGSTDHFQTGRACKVFGTGTDVCDDVDDFHKMQTATRPFVMGSDTIFFHIDVEVFYVDDTFQRYNGRTFHKQVTVRVQDAWPDSSRSPFLLIPITLSRVVSYDF